MTPATQASAAPSTQTMRMTLAHVDADNAGELRVLAHRAHRAADRGARQQQVHGSDEHRRDAERQQLVGRRADAAAERHGDLQRVGVIGGLAR